jgi:hypothetical protein
MVQTPFFLIVRQLMPRNVVIWWIVSTVNFINRVNVAKNMIPATQLSGTKSFLRAPSTCRDFKAAIE